MINYIGGNFDSLSWRTLSVPLVNAGEKKFMLRYRRILINESTPSLVLKSSSFERWVFIFHEVEVAAKIRNTI